MVRSCRGPIPLQVRKDAVVVKGRVRASGDEGRGTREDDAERESPAGAQLLLGRGARSSRARGGGNEADVKQEDPNQ